MKAKFCIIKKSVGEGIWLGAEILQRQDRRLARLGILRKDGRWGEIKLYRCFRI